MGASLEKLAPRERSERGALALLFDFRQRQQLTRPGKRRFTPDLALWRQVRTLRHRADTQHISFGARRVGGIERRAAIGTKDLGAPVAAFGGLHIGLRRSSEQTEIFHPGRNRSAKRRSGKFLAIDTVTDRGTRGIDLGLIGDGTAMTGTMHNHCAATSAATPAPWAPGSVSAAQAS